MATRQAVTGFAVFHSVAALGSLVAIGTGGTGWVVYGVMGLNTAVLVLWTVLAYYIWTGGAQ